MELNDIAKKVQKYLEDTPLVVLGSGASVPYGLPTMGSLGKQILNDSNIQKINCFKSFEKDINTIGLESAVPYSIQNVLQCLQRDIVGSTRNLRRWNISPKNSQNAV